MAIRELLQIEIWSKRTSRIIASVVLLLCGIGLLWTYWATPREKRLARAAIAEADAITSPEGLPQKEFDVRYAGQKTRQRMPGLQLSRYEIESWHCWSKVMFRT
jgi:predicted negative regulator of RcsB-dependent stress response